MFSCSSSHTSKNFTSDTSVQHIQTQSDKNRSCSNGCFVLLFLVTAFLCQEWVICAFLVWQAQKRTPRLPVKVLTAICNLMYHNRLGESVQSILRRHFQLQENPKNKQGTQQEKTENHQVPCKKTQETRKKPARATQQHENNTECVWDLWPHCEPCKL